MDSVFVGRIEKPHILGSVSLYIKHENLEMKL
jgi:hypothetical protein